MHECPKSSWRGTWNVEINASLGRSAPLMPNTTFLYSAICICYSLLLLILFESCIVKNFAVVKFAKLLVTLHIFVTHIFASIYNRLRSHRILSTNGRLIDLLVELKHFLLEKKQLARGRNSKFLTKPGAQEPICLEFRIA